MKALVYQGKGRIAVEERPVPVILTDTDAIVKVTLTTICSSDIHIIHGTVPRAKEGVVLGHEFVGVVQETGSRVTNVKPGDRVAVNVETFCGECFYCRRGWVNNCADENGGWALGCRIDGGQAEYVRIPYAQNGLTIIPDYVTDEEALFTGDLLSTGYWAAKMAEIKPGSLTAVIGAGPAGLCTMMCARLYHPSVIAAVDTDHRRLEMARSLGIADIVLNPDEQDIEKEIKDLTDGRGADSVLEAAGGARTFELSWKIARPNAVVGIVAMYEREQILPLPEMYGKNLIFKTGGVDASDCGKIMRLLSEGKINASGLITHRTVFADIIRAYEMFEKKEDGVIKIAITFGTQHF